MKSRIAPVFALAIAALAVSPLGQSQESNAKPSTPPIRHKVLYYHPSKPPMTAEDRDLVMSQAALSQTIPLWNYSTVAAQDGATYTGMMVGRSPFAHGHRITTIPTYLVPVILTFQDTGEVFDPTTYDGCAPASESVITLIKNSPLIGTPNFTMNGVNVGVGQYLDEFQRANFWAKVGGTPYHTIFSTNPPVLAAVHVTVPTADGQTDPKANFGGCMDIGLMDQAWWDNEVQTVIFPALAAEGVGPANFPQFIFDSVAMYIGNTSNCCVMGYHNSFSNGGVFQTYSVNNYDNSGAFGGINTSVMSHELAEWLNDPNGSNPVPAWGAEGQQSGCQGNLEVGDPLSPGFGTPTNPYMITNTTTGVTYTLQELAFYSWFLGSTPSLGAGGKFSDNGTFSGYSKTCPPGGTN
ncbi:MAG TPA: hypothetical protein VKB38_03840 [Terracidiphilus sp.]|nr:hypothetical protein [Terracidiphilus sp.]